MHNSQTKKAKAIPIMWTSTVSGSSSSTSTGWIGTMGGGGGGIGIGMGMGMGIGIGIPMGIEGIMGMQGIIATGIIATGIIGIPIPIIGGIIGTPAQTRQRKGRGEELRTPG